MMNAPAKTASGQTDQTVDLGAIGHDWAMARQSTALTPEVAEVLTELPSWVSRGLLYVIAAFVVVALLWAGLSKVDVTINARGTLVPDGYVRLVQAAAAGVVRQVLAREGEQVESGRILLQLDAAEARTRLWKLREELLTSQEQLRRAQALGGPGPTTLDQQNRLARLQSEITAAEIALGHTTITAPVSGVITTLEVRSSGAVVQPGQTVATIAPAGARLLLETQVLNKDVAMVDKGLPVKLQFDAFPYQDYGVIEGVVVDISPDAQNSKEQGSFYKVMIAPQQNEFIARGRRLPLRPGLTATALVITARKSVLSILLEPFNRLRSEITG
ncbi:MAG TPA: HlyD family efflux transporter periplasmic adaptor subunit [Blastocatellia bacterium]|nr:HlyD family efflux transporter periplasmic adaptor subunit [Blastocatellia bacterium]